MINHFDDMVKASLENLETNVPKDLFFLVRNQLEAINTDFDANIKDQIANLSSPLPKNVYQNVEALLAAADLAFDQTINSKTFNAQSPVPKNMWQRIMDEKQKRRPIAWWWAAAILLLSSVGSFLFIQQQKKEVYVAKSIEKINSAKKHLVQKTSPISQTNTNQKLANFSNPAEAYSPNNSTTLQSNTFKNSVYEYKSQSKQSNTEANQESLNVLQLKSAAKNNAENETEEFVLENEQGNEVAFNNAKNLAYKKWIQTFIGFNKKLAPAQLNKLINSNTPVIPCPINENAARNDWYAEAYFSPLFVTKNVRDKALNKNAQKGMDSTLNRQISYNAGLSIVKNIGPNVLLKTGIQYNQYNELFKHTTINEKRIITVITIRTVILSVGDTLFIRDTSMVEQIGTATRQKQNHYRQWDIPFTIGYEFGGKDLKLNANLGLIANIRSTYTGQFLDTMQQVIDINKFNNQPIYKTNIGLGLYAGLAIVKTIGPKTDLLIEPHLRLNLSNMANDATWFTQKNMVAGVSLGIRYKLNGNRQRR